MLEKEQIYPEFVSQFSNKLYMLKQEPPFSDYIFLCVGSDKVTGDCYGPLVGKRLEELLKSHYQNIHIIGTLDHTVCAVNLNSVVEKIYQQYQKPCIIAIDSALATKEQIGNILIEEGKTKLAKGVNGRIIEVGDISIKAIVAKDYKIPRYNFSTLQNTSLGLVMKLANITAEGIYQVIKYR